LKKFAARALLDDKWQTNALSSHTRAKRGAAQSELLFSISNGIFP
jgi:hypothetical protein